MKLHTTWSPGLTLVTPGPTSSIIPDPSWPPTIGNRGGRSPSVRCRSEWHSPAAMYLISTSPGPGPSRSSSISSNGLPASSRTAAVGFIVLSLPKFLLRPREEFRDACGNDPLIRRTRNASEHIDGLRLPADHDPGVALGHSVEDGLC